MAKTMLIVYSMVALVLGLLLLHSVWRTTDFSWPGLLVGVALVCGGFYGLLRAGWVGPLGPPGAPLGGPWPF